MKDLAVHIRESLLDLDDSTDIVARLTDSLVGLKKIGKKDIDSIPNVQNIKVFVVPEGVHQIEPEAFRSLAIKPNSLEVLVLPSTLKLVRAGAFGGLKHLREIRWSGNPRKCIFRASVFTTCDSLEVVEIPEGVVELDESVFWCCKNLREVTLPASLAEIRSSLFSGCKSLEKINLTHLRFELLPRYCFSECESLKEIVLPDTCISIGDNAFYGCRNLRAVKAPNVKTLNSACFHNCINLEDFDTDAPYLSFGPMGSAFQDCWKLRTIKPILRGVEAYTFMGCESLEEVRLRCATYKYGTNLGSKAFYGCKSLKRIYVPTGTSEESIRKQLESSNVEPEIIYDESIK